MSVGVLGSGAFGTALALALAQDGAPVTLWGRDAEDVAEMRATRRTGRRLPGIELPRGLTPRADLAEVEADVLLLAIPTQKLGAFLDTWPDELAGRVLVSCAKGIDLRLGIGPGRLIARSGLAAASGVLTGPSFAADISRGLPTALVLAMDARAAETQDVLTRPALRIYRSDDVVGAELGGALKNVVALAAGMAEGAGFGASARAAVVARGFAEMTRYATRNGARPETLSGLSGLGDLFLTASSEKSRNYSAGIAFGRGEAAPDVTTEGIATAAALAAAVDDDTMPIAHAVHAVTTGRATVADAVSRLLARPVTRE